MRLRTTQVEPSWSCVPAISVLAFSCMNAFRHSMAPMPVHSPDSCFFSVNMWNHWLIGYQTFSLHSMAAAEIKGAQPAAVAGLRQVDPGLVVDLLDARDALK